MIVYPEGTTEEQKKWIDYIIKQKEIELNSIYVLYKTNCDCDDYNTVLLDRLPMSGKIHHYCDKCKKGSLAEIVLPMEFYHPLTKQLFTIEDLVNFEVQEGRQAPYLIRLQNIAKEMVKLKGKKKKADYFDRMMDFYYDFGMLG